MKDNYYKVGLVIGNMGWVDFDFNVPTSYPIAQPILPSFHLPKQNRTDSRMIETKSTQPGFWPPAPHCKLR